MALKSCRWILTCIRNNHTCNVAGQGIALNIAENHHVWNGHKLYTVAVISSRSVPVIVRDVLEWTAEELDEACPLPPYNCYTE